MNRIDVGNLGGADHLWNVQVTFARSWRPYTHRLIGEAHVQRVPVRLGVDGNRGDAELLARIDDAQGDFTTIGNEDFSKHFRPVEPKTRRLLLFARGPERKERFAVFHRLAIFHQNSRYLSAYVRFNFIH